MRRIDRNLRVLYVSLACLAGLIYVAPSPVSPMEAAKARRRRETRAHARGETHRFVEKANVSLAPGSPLYARQGTVDGRYGGTWMDAARGDEAWGGDETYERFRRASGELPGPGGARRFYDRSFDGRGADGRRSIGEVEQRAALHAGWQRARFGAKVVANAGGTLNGGNSSNGGQNGPDFVGPEWASGGFAGAGISRRVLPYQRGEVGGNGHGNGRGPGGSNAEIQCAKCGYELLRAARYCGMCGTRTTSPGSVVRRPYADPQDTGTSVGRGRERARAAVEAAARVAAADGEASSDGDPR